MFQPKVTPVEKVHCCAPPSQMWYPPEVVELDMVHRSPSGIV